MNDADTPVKVAYGTSAEVTDDETCEFVGTSSVDIMPLEIVIFVPALNCALVSAVKLLIFDAVKFVNCEPFPLKQPEIWDAVITDADKIPEEDKFVV